VAGVTQKNNPMTVFRTFTRVWGEVLTILRHRVKKKPNEIRFLVENFVCTGCAEDMENILFAMDGIVEAAVDYGSGIFSIQYDAEEIKRETIIKKVRNFGFKTKILTG